MLAGRFFIFEAYFVKYFLKSCFVFVVSFYFLACVTDGGIDAFAAKGGGGPGVIGLQERDSLGFGTIIIDTLGDTITLSPAGTISAQNMSMFSGTVTAGHIRATGDKNTAVSITFSSGDVLSGPGASMPLGNFTHDAGSSPAFDGRGKLEFNIGASLTVNPGQIDGNYSGTYVVYVDYL